MSSQSEEIYLCPEGHGVMVPTNYEFCLLDASGFVIGLVIWRWEEGRGIYASGYFQSEQGFNDLPSGETLGEQIVMLHDEGRLVSFYDELLDGNPGILQVEDNRVGHKWAYMVWQAAQRHDGPSFKPGTVYHWFTEGDDDDVHEHPVMTEVKDVVALRNVQGARYFEYIAPELVGKQFDEPEVLSIFGDLRNCVIIWNRSAMKVNSDLLDPVECTCDHTASE